MGGRISDQGEEQQAQITLFEHPPASNAHGSIKGASPLPEAVATLVAVAPTPMWAGPVFVMSHCFFLSLLPHEQIALTTYLKLYRTTVFSRTG
jgi:hypothetical protein